MDSAVNALRLYSFFNSSASYRVRIAIAVKNMDVESVYVNLRDQSHRTPEYLTVNAWGLVPALEVGDETLTQSLAIIGMLDELDPSIPMIPLKPWPRARALEIASCVACEIHPLNNPRVLARLTAQFGADDEARRDWYSHWIHTGFAPLEGMLADGGWCLGPAPTVADCFVVPQIANARRMKIDLSMYPRLLRIEEQARSHPAFMRAAPENQPDRL